MNPAGMYPTGVLPRTFVQPAFNEPSQVSTQGAPQGTEPPAQTEGSSGISEWAGKKIEVLHKLAEAGGILGSLASAVKEIALLCLRLSIIGSSLADELRDKWQELDVQPVVANLHQQVEELKQQNKWLQAAAEVIRQQFRTCVVPAAPQAPFSSGFMMSSPPPSAPPPAFSPFGYGTVQPMQPRPPLFSGPPAPHMQRHTGPVRYPAYSPTPFDAADPRFAAERNVANLVARGLQHQPVRPSDSPTGDPISNAEGRQEG